MDPTVRSARQQILRGLRDLAHENPIQLPILIRNIRAAGPARAWATLQAALRDPIEEKLALLRVPTLVLRGALELIVPARWAREAAQLVPGGVLATVAGSPHHSFYVAADALVTEILAFLQRTRISRRANMHVWQRRTEGLTPAASA